jgi:hypothetical protein
MSNFAEAAGVVVPIPTWACVVTVKNRKKKAKKSFMLR